MVRIIAKEGSSIKVFLIVYFHLRFSIALISLKLINTNNHGNETGENPKPYIWSKKAVNLVRKSLKREVSDNRSMRCERGREAEDCSLSGFSFSACIIS